VCDVEIALLVFLYFRLVDGFQAGALQETVNRLFRRTDPRAFLFLAPVGLTRRQADHRERDPPRRGKRFRAFVHEAARNQRVRDELLEILLGLRLHPRRDLFGEQFEKKVGHALRPERRLDAC
jgi:hypothetical protein